LQQKKHDLRHAFKNHKLIYHEEKHFMIISSDRILQASLHILTTLSLY